MVSRKIHQGKRIVWIDADIAQELDAMGEKEGLSEKRNRYAEMARTVLNRAIRAIETCESAVQAETASQ
jgi:hypothetical protein